MIKLVTILLFSYLNTNATKFYVTTTGTAGNTGSLASPWSLTKAFSHPAAVQPGDTIYVQPGTYTGIFTSELTGTSGHPIKLIAVGRVILDGTLAGQAIKRLAVLTINGAYTWYWGFEITNSDPEREILVSGSNPDERRGNSTEINAPGTKIINCIIYDTGQGLGAWTPATNSEYYGNLIYNNGWWAPDREHGHGIYTQNQTGTKTYKDNIILNNFGNGWNMYGSDAAFLNNFYLEGNVSFNDYHLLGGSCPMRNIELNTNFFYKDPPYLGYSSDDNDSLRLINNQFPSGFSQRSWEDLTATGNTIFTYKSENSPFAIPRVALSTWHFNNNTYHWQNTGSVNSFNFYWNDPAVPPGEGSMFLPEWQSNGQDATVNFDRYALVGGFLVLTGKKTFVRQNTYDATRSNVVIYNWDLASTVNVGVAGILSTGDTYELRNVQNYFGDVVTGTFSGDSLTVPMTGHTVAEPLGLDTTFGENTFPEFGTFVLIKTGAASDSPHVTPVANRGQTGNLVHVKSNTGSALPHVTLRSGTGGGGGGEEPPPTGDADLAFQGFGKTNLFDTTGLTVTHVGNLNATGAGSLHAAMLLGGNRKIVFDVGGTINNFVWNSSDESTDNANLFIDGSTAPSPGITINGTGTSRSAFAFEGPLNHDIIFKCLRIRKAYEDGITITDGAFDFMIDHCSVSGISDGGIDVTTDSHNVTVQYTIFGPGGDWAGKSDKWSGSMLIAFPPVKDVTVHHNIFYPKTVGGIGERCPFIHNSTGGAPQVISYIQADVRNNLVYSFGRNNGTGSGYGTGIDYNGTANVIANYYYTAGSTPENGVDLDADPGGGSDALAYCSGNISGNGEDFNSISNHGIFSIAAYPTTPTTETACAAAQICLSNAGCRYTIGATTVGLDATDLAIIAAITLTGCL